MKKIFVFMMAMLMVCGLALPIFATEPATINVNIVDYDGTYATKDIEVPKTPTVKNVLKLISEVSYSSTNGVITSVNGKTAKDINSPFNGEWVVAVNGKIASLDAPIEAEDRVTIYWNEPAFNTRLVQVKQLNNHPDVLQFYYIDATGVEVSVVNAITQLTCNGETVINTITKTNEFITDEKGQIWLDPEYISDPENIIKVISIDEILPDTMPEFNTDHETEYYKARVGKSLIICEAINTEFSYNALNSPATGDMTLAYGCIGLLALLALMGLLIFKNKNTHQTV